MDNLKPRQELLEDINGHIYKITYYLSDPGDISFKSFLNYVESCIHKAKTEVPHFFIQRLKHLLFMLTSQVEIPTQTYH